MKPYFICIFFLITEVRQLLGQNSSSTPSKDSTKTFHFIPVNVQQWTCLFQVSGDDNKNEDGILLVHVVLDKNGSLISASSVASNLTKNLTAIYLQRMKETWRVLRFEGKEKPEKSEGNFHLDVHHF